MRTPRFAHPGRLPASPRRGWLRVALVLGACTAIAELMAPHLDPANIIMVYLAGVVYVALHEHAAVALGTVAASIFLFDLIFVPPRWGLHPIDPHHIFTFGVMLAVGLLISQLAAWARRQAELAEGRAQRADALSRLAERLASAASRDSVARAVAAVVAETFGARATLELDPGAPCGTPALSLQLTGTGPPLGRLALRDAGSGWAAEDLQLLEAFAHQAALALERCAFEEKSSAAQVQVESERLRSTLLAGISHDFRTPLTAIVGAATVLLEQGDRLDAARRERLTHGVLDEARRLHGVMSDLLDLTRMEEGAVQLQHEWCPADDLVGEALAALGAARTVGVRWRPTRSSGATRGWCSRRCATWWRTRCTTRRPARP
ncbi:DUF4118 domain-containing protein [Ramlibacter terrae]|uniref:histidine kinase n=1 Tax=Ramlibacter terrae TaxID=2732511 RepID=A0ABX6P4L5_9BURK|nr:DUF4118 domain-containing protein [Ramlibacter terrae]